LGAEKKLGQFNIHFDPYSSSLLPLNETFHHYYRPGSVDYVLAEGMRTIEKLEIQITTLDCVTETEAPPPDFLSIDAEGAEMEILRGSSRVLKQHALAVHCEVWFQPIHTGQGLFEDVKRLLEENGFQFIGFSDMLLELSPNRLPIGQRGRGIAAASEAMFMLSLEELAIRYPIPSELYSKAMKLALIAIRFGQFEFAHAAIALAEKQKISAPKRKYISFLAKLKSLTDQAPRVFPPTWVEANRGVPGERQPIRGVGLKGRLRNSIIQYPGLYKTVQVLRRTLKSYKVVGEMFKILIRKVKGLHSTPIERHLSKHGFEDVAQLIKANRIEAT
jgi:hypothetical protein